MVQSVASGRRARWSPAPPRRAFERKNWKPRRSLCPWPGRAGPGRAPGFSAATPSGNLRVCRSPRSPSPKAHVAESLKAGPLRRCTWPDALYRARPSNRFHICALPSSTAVSDDRSPPQIAGWRPAHQSLTDRTRSKFRDPDSNHCCPCQEPKTTYAAQGRFKNNSRLPTKGLCQGQRKTEPKPQRNSKPDDAAMLR